MRVAAERGAELTRQLLAFGRCEMLEPRPTDLRELLTGMEGLMRRTIGEHIRIEFRMPPACGLRPSIRASSNTRCSTSCSMRATQCRTADG